MKGNISDKIERLSTFRQIRSSGIQKDRSPNPGERSFYERRAISVAGVLRRRAEEGEDRRRVRREAVRQNGFWEVRRVRRVRRVRPDLRDRGHENSSYAFFDPE